MYKVKYSDVYKLKKQASSPLAKLLIGGGITALGIPGTIYGVKKGIDYTADKVANRVRKETEKGVYQGAENFYNLKIQPYKGYAIDAAGGLTGGALGWLLTSAFTDKQWLKALVGILGAGAGAYISNTYRNNLKKRQIIQ